MEITPNSLLINLVCGLEANGLEDNGLTNKSEESKLLTYLNCEDDNYDKQVIIFIVLNWLKRKYEETSPITNENVNHFTKKCKKIEAFLKNLTTLDDMTNCIRICHHCNKTHIKYTVEKCAECKSVYYCNYECQREDWVKKGSSSHKKQCPILKELNNSNENESEHESEHESGNESDDSGIYTTTNAYIDYIDYID